MRNRTGITMLISLTILLFSCNEDDDISSPPLEFSINGSIEGNSLAYRQTIFDGGSNTNINVFNRVDKTLYLQSFKNGEDDIDGFWTIVFTGIDIENLTLPYSLTGNEGSVAWVDESIIELQEPCISPDVLCFYSGFGTDEVSITITDITSDTITGEFEGKLNHIRVNPTVTKDLQDFVEVLNGQFHMQFQVK